LGIRTSTSTGRSVITISKDDLNTILVQYGFSHSDTPENNSKKLKGEYPCKFR